jgi:CBS domain-containing membrane protein
MNTIAATLARWIGLHRTPASLHEQLISGLGGLIGIAIVLWISDRLVEGAALPLIVASMGASAVLLFAVPHGPLSQPWPLLGGHLLGAAIGVGCAQLPLPLSWSASLAVGTSIALMYTLRCIHPPGGATALTAVVGGAQVHDLGFDFVLMPVALNAVSILVVAVAFNYPFRWRRYPAALAMVPVAASAADKFPGPATIDHADLVAALAEIDSYIDISEQDLLRIYALATRHAETDRPPAPEIVVGGFYSNGRYGADWEVRRVDAIEPTGSHGAGKGNVRFTVVAGTGRRSRGRSSLDAFGAWAAQRVSRDENTWRPAQGLDE